MSLRFLFVVLLAACAGQSVTVRAEVPFIPGPVIIEIIVDGRPTHIDNTGTSRTVNGKTYEVYRDSTGTEWLRDPTPPNRLVRADTMRPASQAPGTDADAVTLGIVNTRQTSREFLWDFNRHTAAAALAATGLDRVTNQRGIPQTLRGAMLAHFDNVTLETHVIYPMRTDIGIPDLAAHPSLRYDIQLLDGFMSIAIEGDLRDVARFLAQQGTRVIRGIPLSYQDATYDVDVVIDEPSRLVTFVYGTQILRAIPF